VLRLFYDINACLFDVWDNRQIEALRRYFKQFAQVIDKEMELDSTRSEHIHNLLESVSRIKSFADLYEFFGFKYVVNPKGTLDQFEDESFNLVVSSGVLEHVDKASLPGLVREFSRLLKPEGYSVHHIVIADHLAMYDPSVSKKNYLKYSDSIWKTYFENGVQQFNRVQRPEWLCLFNSAELRLIEEFVWTRT
jgi:SAM-dependent methyltransferase